MAEQLREQLLFLFSQYAQKLTENCDQISEENDCNKIDEWARENEAGIDFLQSLKNTVRTIEEFTTEQTTEYKRLLARKYVVEEQLPTKKEIPVSLETINVNTISDIPNTKLYYVVSIGQFAIKINGTVLYGNIGKVGKDLEKTIECKNNFCRNPQCKFYHLPLKYPWKFDIRNFTPSSWIYDPFTERIGVKRRICNREDVQRTRKEDFEYQNSLLMHDLLILLQMSQILHQTRRK